jgi:hypothetical protein
MGWNLLTLQSDADNLIVLVQYRPSTISPNDGADDDSVLDARINPACVYYKILIRTAIAVVIVRESENANSISLAYCQPTDTPKGD